MERITSCTTLSDHVGMPSGRVPPLRFGIFLRRTGVHFHRSYRIASMILAIFSVDIPSTVSSVVPGVIAPSFLYNLAYARRYMSGLYSCRYTSSSGSPRLPRSWIMFRIVSAVRISRTCASFHIRNLPHFAIGVFFDSSYPSCGRLSRPLTTIEAPSP